VFGEAKMNEMMQYLYGVYLKFRGAEALDFESRTGPVRDTDFSASCFDHVKSESDDIRSLPDTPICFVMSRLSS
jgi:hypothetical protein